MAVKIWDEQSNAFKDAETPMVWDEALGAYKDSTGLVYNENAGAWSERFGDKLWLYKDGNEYEKITNGWRISSGGSGSGGSGAKNKDNMYVKGKHVYAVASSSFYAVTNKQIDITSYKKICCEVVNFSSNAPSVQMFGPKITNEHIYYDFQKNYAAKPPYNDGVYELDISDQTGSFYIALGTNPSTGNSGAGYTIEYTIKKVWLE